MAATAAHGLAPALSPPITTAYVPALRINRRFSNDTITTSAVGVGPDCKKFNAFKTCSSDGEYGSCMGTGATSSCNCNYGLDYLDCVSSAVATSSCEAVLGLGNWADYTLDWLQRSCNKPPQSVMISITQPSYVDISYQPVVTVTPTTPITTSGPNRIAPPSYSGTGELLAGPCTQAQYSLIDAGDMVYQAAIVGCDADRPECCPFEVATTSADGGKNRVAGVGGGFPSPGINALSALTACPDDYYPVSGQCCPNGYYKFTTKIAYQTPCFSSQKSKMTPPPVTVGLPNNPTDLSKPTSAINNLVWAMGYNMTQPSSGLSQAATIGIGVGAGVFGIAVIALLAMVFIRIRRSKKAALAEQQSDQTHHQPSSAAAGGTTYSQGYAAAPQNMSPPTSPPLPQMHQNYHQPQMQQQQQQHYNAGSWNQGYDDYGQYDQQQQHQQHQQQYGYQQPAVYDQGYRR